MGSGGKISSMEEAKYEQIWIWLVVIRFWLVIACLPGYIHPDEFFQSPEVMAADVLDVKSFVPWEFASVHHPLRSVFAPALISGLPMLVLKWVTAGLQLVLPRATLISPYTVVVAPRLMMFFCSLLIDWCIAKICRRVGLNPYTRLCVLGSSFVTLIMHTRPFSNSVESVLFALALYLAVPSPVPKLRFGSSWRLVFLGGVLAAGLFNRPTFGLLLVGIGLLVLWEILWTKSHIGDASHNLLSRVLSSEFLQLVWTVGSAIALGFTVAALGLILLDSLYFGSLQFQWDYLGPFVIPWLRGNLTVTPWNFIKYNTNSTNLATHGVHFRGTHVLVNGALLFGPLYMLAMCVVSRKVLRAWSSCLPQSFNPSLKKYDTPKGKKSSHYGSRISQQVLVCGGLFLIGLSLFPHQEARFLLPLLIPLVISFGNRLAKSGSWILCLWMIFNAFMAIFYGVVHQGGVQRSLFGLQKATTSLLSLDNGRSQVHIVYWYTYMPPRHILLSGRTDDVNVYDMGSADHESVAKLMQRLSQKQKVDCDTTARPQVKIYLVAPHSLEYSVPSGFLQSFQFWGDYFPHFSGEAPPGGDITDTLTLDVWERTIDTINVDGKTCIAPVRVSTGTS